MMAVKWSWAFGQETPTQLNDDMGWSVNAPANNGISTTFTYTYAGSPTRSSFTADGSAEFDLPVSSFALTGWITLAVYNDSANWSAGNYPIRVFAGASRYIGIYMSNAASNTFELYVDNLFKQSFTMTLNNWNYIALKYDVSVADWSGQVYLNGAAVTTAHTRNFTGAQTTGNYRLEGFSTTNESTYFAQFIVYDDLADAGETPLFVTRLPPNAANAADTTAGWAAVGAGTTLLATNTDPLDTAKYAQEATPVSGDKISTEVNNLIAQLGLTAGTVRGATNHTYSSGVNVQVFASCRDSGQASYTDGATITPDSADTTYGFGTTTTGLGGSSTIQCKYEVV